ncbi:hypothetical protein [Microbacterium sp. ZW T5_56]|uniref:hypothetical protein n=1 Tax=Microbacterium sp. ZW T5_56 TaxID=3378081 RepID=UPI003851BD27
MDPLIDFFTNCDTDTWEQVRPLLWLARPLLRHLFRGLSRAYRGRAGNQPQRTISTTGGQRRHPTIHPLHVISQRRREAARSRARCVETIKLLPCTRREVALSLLAGGASSSKLPDP